MPEESTEVYERLRAIMRDHLAYLKSLPPVDGRSRIISEKVCPFVTTIELEQLFNTRAPDFEHHVLPIDDSAFPGATDLWMLWGDRVPGGRELLAIYTGPQFCAARYTINT